MNENRKQSKSFSRKKSSYAPIMLTSKAVKPVAREDKLQFQNQSRLDHNKKFRSKLARFTRHSQVQLLSKHQEGIEVSEEIDRMNMTQQNVNNFRVYELDKTFSHSCKKTRHFQDNSFQIILGQKQQLEESYQNRKNDKQLQSFCLRQPSASTVVNVQFNQENITQKISRKNNANNHRYNAIFAFASGVPNTNRPYKSVTTNPKNSHGQNAKDGEQFVIQINGDRTFKLVSPSTKNNLCLSISKPVQNNVWFKDSTKKMTLSQKQKTFDLTFTNFKQKIYEKKLSKLSNHKSKYNQQWNEYLNKYYLNIKKVRPLMKYDAEEQENQQKNMASGRDVSKKVNNQNQTKRDAKSSAEMLINHNSEENNQDVVKKLIKICSTNEGFYDNLQTQKMDRMRSNSMMTSSKTTTALSSSDLSPLLSPKKSQKNHDNDQAKIQSDIVTKRISTNKKDYFVFSMGDSSNQNKSQNPNIAKFNLYKDFLWKVNYSNGLHARFPDDFEKPYKFFVGRGNNSAIVKGIMRRRFWWQLVDKISPQVNFIWTQLRVNDFVKSQKKRKNQQLKHLLNSACHHESFTENNQISNQAIKQNYELNKKIFRGNDLMIWLSHIKQNFKHEERFIQQTTFNILQKRIKSMVKRKRLTYIDSSLTPQQKSHNHFQCNYYIGNKKALFYAMRKYYKLYGQDPFDFIPLTYHINGGLQDPEFNEFLEKYNQFNDERMKNKNSELKNIWIVKPGQVTNRGKGITVCATLDDIKIRLKSKQKNSDGSPRTYILQKYIQKPLLYQKRKFDIRHYMLMTCINGCIKGYWYQEGYIRTTSTQYNIKNCKDLYTHLTNDAIQKNSSDYGKYEKGNKISYDEFQKYLTKTYRKDFNFYEQILSKMKRLATDAMRATYSIIEPNKRQNNFELFGLDFMLDENMKVYLIECNTNPCLQLSCPLLAKIITGLIQNVFKICIDPIFPPPFEWPNSKKFQMGDNSLNEMKFQLVFDEAYEGRQLERLYGTEKGFGDKIGKVEEQQQEYEDDGSEDQEWNQDQNT